LECEVKGWDIKIPYNETGYVDRAMARKFALLFSKADGNRLSETETTAWISILDQVDFTSYCINRAAPHYLEGEFRRLKPECYVDWSDGRTERIDHGVATAFSELKPGDLFGAYVKLGLDNKALSVERVAVLSAA
jgi:hypothetical protein